MNKKLQHLPCSGRNADEKDRKGSKSIVTLKPDKTWENS